MSTKDKLVMALTDYDRKASRRAGYNHYALGQYFQRVDEIVADIESGADVRAAILAGFSGRVADCCLKAVGLGRAFQAENQGGSWAYKPAGGGK